MVSREARLHLWAGVGGGRQHRPHRKALGSEDHAVGVLLLPCRWMQTGECD